MFRLTTTEQLSSLSSLLFTVYHILEQINLYYIFDKTACSAAGFMLFTCIQSDVYFFPSTESTRRSCGPKLVLFISHFNETLQFQTHYGYDV